MGKTTSTKKELNTVEAARLLGLSPSTLKKWRSTHEHPELIWHKRFRRVFYFKEDVLAFKDSNTKTSSSEIYI